MSKKRLFSTFSAAAMALSVVGTSSFAGITANAEEPVSVAWNNHTYAVIQEELNPIEADEYCKKLGGHLVTITSQEEQDFIASLASEYETGSMLIGCSDNETEGTWYWLNGEPFEFSAWYPGGSAGSSEPNDGLGGGEDYAVISRSRGWQWVDVFGGYDNYSVKEWFICEWDNEQPEITKVNPDVTATAGTCCVNLDWNAVDNAQKYAVCGYVNGAWKILAKTADTSYTLQNLKPCTDYKVAVIAMFEGKWYKDFSKAIIVTPVHEYPTVNRVSISSKTRQTKIEWEPVAGAEGYCLATSVNGKWNILGHTKANVTFVITPKLKRSTVYTFAVCAAFNGKWDTSNINERAFKVYTL